MSLPSARWEATRRHERSSIIEIEAQKAAQVELITELICDNKSVVESALELQGLERLLVEEEDKRGN